MRRNREICTCKLMITKWQQPFHERSIWHKNWELIKRCIEAGMNMSQIAKQVGVTPGYVNARLRAIRESVNGN
jgi:hypothetical protein